MATAAYPNINQQGYPLRVLASLSPRCYHTGGAGPVAGVVGTDASGGTNATPVVTETYISELLVGHTCLVRGISIKNGAVAGTNSIVVALLDVNGNVLANSILTGTVASGTSAYQNLAFINPIQIRPGTYYVAAQYNGTTTRYAAHTVGAFGAGKNTGTVFGTLTGLVPPITFTTALGPMASLF